MKRTVRLIWTLLLIAGYLVIAPIAVLLLQRALEAARNIEHYTAEILAGSGGIVTNTEQVAALKETQAAAPQLLASVASLERHLATIRSALTGGDGHVQSEEVQP